jgi:hypothetical protein
LLSLQAVHRVQVSVVVVVQAVLELAQVLQYRQVLFIRSRLVLVVLAIEQVVKVV